MFRRRFVQGLRKLACVFAALLASGAAAQAQNPGGTAPSQPAAAAPATWLVSSGGGMPWQVGAMFTGFWVLTAAEIAIISKSANRLDKPKKKEDALQAD